MGVSDTTEKNLEEHYKEYLASITEEYKIGYNKAIDDFCEAMDNEMFSTEWVKIIYHTIAEKLKVGDNNESV